MPDVTNSLGLAPAVGGLRPFEPRPTPLPPLDRDASVIQQAGDDLSRAADRLELSQTAVRAPEEGGRTLLEERRARESEPPPSPNQAVAAGRNKDVIFNRDLGTFQTAIRRGDEEIARLPPDNLVRARQNFSRFVQENILRPSDSPDFASGEIGRNLDEEA